MSLHSVTSSRYISGYSVRDAVETGTIAIGNMDREPNILVVDDDREICTMLGDYLEKNGFSATAVADGQQTRHALAQ